MKRSMFIVFGMILLSLSFVNALGGDIGVCFYGQDGMVCYDGDGNPIQENDSNENQNWFSESSALQKIYYELRAIVNSTEYDNCLSINSTEDALIKLEIGELCYNTIGGENEDYEVNQNVYVPSFGQSIKLTINDKEYYVPMINSVYALSNAKNMGNITQWSKNVINENLYASDNSFYSGNIIIYVSEGVGQIFLNGVIIEDNGERISTLESWKETITDLLDNFFEVLFPAYEVQVEEHKDTLQDHKTRLTTLEGDDSEIFPSYLNKLSSSIRKRIVCSYAEENHLTGMQGLGWTCGMTYKTSRSGRVSARCSCKRG